MTELACVDDAAQSRAPEDVIVLPAKKRKKQKAQDKKGKGKGKHRDRRRKASG